MLNVNSFRIVYSFVTYLVLFWPVPPRGPLAEPFSCCRIEDVSIQYVTTSITFLVHIFSCENFSHCYFRSVVLSVKQGEVAKALYLHHNVFCTGNAGMGKTMLMKTNLQDLRSQGKHVAVTVTTGMACNQYQGMDPMTLHSFTGIKDGRFSREFTVARIMQNHICNKVMGRDVLFIDEVSQLSRTFENLDFIFKTVRNNTFPFGGIQVVAVGDFHQLPP